MPVSAAFDDPSKMATLPQSLGAQYPGHWHIHGQGIFTWSVFRVYRAALHVQGERFDAGALYALDLNYLRNVSAEQIVQTSVEEMRRLSGIDESRLTQWSEQLRTILPDVSLGDRLVGVFVPGEGVTFFSREAALGQVQDPAFVNAFAAVWLDAQTRAPALRAQLLGLST